MNLRTIFGGLIGMTIIMLVGCGDENDSASSNPASSNLALSSGINNVTFGGIAAKGIINGGKVVAEELDASGTVIAQIGNTTTSADGSYTLAVDNHYNGGPIRVTISADENTQMKCDVPLGCGMRTDDIMDNDTTIDFSEWYKPGSLTMKALIAEAVANDTIDVNITPYTDLAANRAMMSASLTAAEVYSRNSEVSNLLGGINILTTPPLDITDATVINDGNATEIAYAALSAAIAGLADVSGGNPNINAVLALLLSSFSDGTIIADDTGTVTDDSTLSLQEILDGAISALAHVGIADTSGIFVSLQKDIDDAIGGSIDPEPSPGIDAVALAKVKAFVNDVRTWGTVIEEETRVKGNAFSTQVNLALTAANASTSLVINSALRSTVAVIFKRLTDTTATELTAYAVGVAGAPQFESGSIAYSGDVITITDGVIDGVTINMNVQLPDDGSTVTSLLAVINSATLMSASSDFTINNGTITATLATPYLIDYTAVNMNTAARPDISGGSIDLNVTLVQKQDGLGAMLVSPVTFAGTLSTTLLNPVNDTTNEITWFIPSTLSLAGSVSDTVGNSFDASLTANISNAATFTPVGELNAGSGFVLENAANWLAGTIGLNFTLQLDGLPEASINISGDRTAFEAGTATITIIYGVRQIVIVGAFSSHSSTGSVMITNQDGVTMSVVGANFNASTGDIEYNGQSYASITKLDSGLTKITYIDGTFETL